MSKKVIITADSPSDINQAFQKEIGLDEIIPLHIILGEEIYEDGVNIDAEKMLQYYDETSILPKTSAVSIDGYLNIFKKYPADEYEIVHFSLSSKISSTHYNAILAAKELSNVFVCDTESLSFGIAFMLLDALDMRKEGKTATEIYDKMTTDKAKYKATFILDNLEFLHKGGRCSALTALGANVLKIKPCIVMTDGSLNLGKKYRGKLEVCQTQYIKDRLEALGENLSKDRVFIAYTSGVSQKFLDTAQKDMKKHGFKEVYTKQAGCTITAHCGRNTFAIMLKEK